MGSGMVLETLTKITNFKSVIVTSVIIIGNNAQVPVQVPVQARSTLNILVILYWNFFIRRYSHIIADLMARFHMSTAIIVSKNVTRGHFVHH
jgi:hypothetical protein